MQAIDFDQDGDPDLILGSRYFEHVSSGLVELAANQNPLGVITRNFTARLLLEDELVIPIGNRHGHVIFIRNHKSFLVLSGGCCPALWQAKSQSLIAMSGHGLDIGYATCVTFASVVSILVCFEPRSKCF